MADQMRCMGFDFSQPGSLERFFDAKWPDKTLLDMACGVYLRMDVQPDMACWLSVDPETHEVLDWEMHYDSGRTIGCSFERDVSLDDAGQSGNIAVQLLPGEADIPLTVSVPCLAGWEDREAGSPGLLQPTAYALQLRQAEETEEDRLQSDADDNTATLTGMVEHVQKLTNAYSGLCFGRMTVNCGAVCLGVLCEPEVLPEVGKRIVAACVLTATVQSGTLG